MTPRERGFTLLELLVAMFIAAILFAMGYGTINQAVKNRETLEAQQARLLELQTTVRTMEQDFVQLAQRPVRDPVGGTFQPALLAAASSSTALDSVAAPPATAMARGDSAALLASRWWL